MLIKRINLFFELREDLSYRSTNSVLTISSCKMILATSFCQQFKMTYSACHFSPDPSRRDNSELDCAISSEEPFSGEVYRYRRENSIAGLLLAEPRKGRPSSHETRFRRSDTQYIPPDEILTKNTYRSPIEFLSTLWFIESGKNKLYKYPIS